MSLPQQSRLIERSSVKSYGMLAVFLLASSARVAAADEAHDKLNVMDLKIGMPIEGHPGFTCEKEKRTESGERQDRHCVKFIDDRCKGKPAALGYKRYGEKAPKGCYLDYSSQATFLDDLLMQDPNTNDTSQRRNGRRPLANVHLIGTEASPSKIYKIYYMFAEDDLAETSKLYKALVAKYGEARDSRPGRMRWKIDSTELEAECTPDSHCQIIVNDRKFEESEEDAQKEADAQKKRDAAPAPKL